MTITVGIIIGVTLFFTICSIVLNRREPEETEFTLSAKPAAWENGGPDLTSPMLDSGKVEEVSSPKFEPLTPLPGSRLRPIDIASVAQGGDANGQPAPLSEQGAALSEEIIRGLEQIPPLPKGVQAVLRELDSAGASAKSVGDIVASDPVVGAVVLRVVNSAAMGLRRRVLTVKEAVTFL